MQEISSKERVEKRKHDFYANLLPKIKERQERIKHSILDKTSNVLVMPGQSGLKLGPVFGKFDPQKEYKKTYKEIVEDLVLGLNPYKITIEKPNVKTQDIQELSLTKNDVELDVSFDAIHYNFEPDSILQPIGFKAKIKDLHLIGNPKIPWQVDQVLQENQKAIESIYILGEYGFDNYYLTKIFSAGNLGLDKKFVTTRQSITAIDDTLAKKLLIDIREFEHIDSYYVFENEFLHNRFVIVLAKGNWEYEQFELWPSQSEWGKFGYNHEYEGFLGRTNYAELQAGGYYAARLPIIEYLHRNKKQARVLVIREIYDDYSIPIGVWQVRENVRSAMTKQSKIFNSKVEVLTYIEKHLKYNLKKYIDASFLFKQNRLNDFF
ncbi:MAG: hypothetical protein COT14_02870 [Candidatus Diapherotrites archaeon CG08_land_8_20_14_0_20_30_16]|nr:MAG: hypothetical protein COT14_02870 [Candidatus Diapherotrites archaeon CG08_land_8_20_14_0_20_30_16]